MEVIAGLEVPSRSVGGFKSQWRFSWNISWDYFKQTLQIDPRVDAFFNNMFKKSEIYSAKLEKSENQNQKSELKVE